MWKTGGTLCHNHPCFIPPITNLHRYCGTNVEYYSCIKLYYVIYVEMILLLSIFTDVFATLCVKTCQIINITRAVLPHQALDK